MRKEIQRGVNDAILKAIGEVNQEIEDSGKTFVSRLRTCNARVYQTQHWYILESYATMIACIDKRHDIGYDFLRWIYGYTATSAQHMSKFFKDFGQDAWGTRVIYSWRHID